LKKLHYQVYIFLVFFESKKYLKGTLFSLKMQYLNCTALPKSRIFIEPPPDTQRRRRRGERGIGVTRGSYLLLTSLSPLPLSPSHTARLLRCLGLRYQDMPPPPHSTFPWTKISDFQEERLKRRTASI
jgi:hypothetical protein